MHQPPLEKLLKKVDNKYSLVVLAAKRARQITQNEYVDDNGTIIKGKPVTLALYEISNKKYSSKATLFKGEKSGTPNNP